MLSDLQSKGRFLSGTEEKSCPPSAQEASPLASFCNPRLNVINSILCTEFCQFHSHGVVRIYSVSWRNARWNETICTPVVNMQKRSVPAPGAVTLRLVWFINQVPVHGPAQLHVLRKDVRRHPAHPMARSCSPPAAAPIRQSYEGSHDFISFSVHI